MWKTLCTILQTKALVFFRITHMLFVKYCVKGPNAAGPTLFRLHPQKCFTIWILKLTKPSKAGKESSEYWWHLWYKQKFYDFFSLLLNSNLIVVLVQEYGMHEVVVTNEGEAVKGAPSFIRSMPNSKKDYDGIEPCAVGSTVEVLVRL